MTQTVKAARPSVNAWSADFLEAGYARWKEDPASVAGDMARFFEGFDLALAHAPAAAAAAALPSAAMGEGGVSSDLHVHAAAASLVYHYRDIGHMCAQLDPFGRERPCPEQLTPAFHGLGEAHLDMAFDTGGLTQDPRPLREIIGTLDETYCRSVGVEYMHIQETEEREWLGMRMESARNRPNLSPEERTHVLHELHRSEMFETFLHKRYVGQKRFSLEGAESLIPLLNRIVEKAADLGIHELVTGMAHRGRLNVLNNVLGKTYEQIFTEFEENWDEDFVEGGGDVKYHLGYSGEITTRAGKTIRVVMSSNPSHLEAVNAVVEGRCRAKQRLKADKEREHVVPLLVHGDAAFIGQGVVQETLNMSQLRGYTTGGTIHVIVNNLIGFTTGPQDARSTRYCTDVARMIDAPIFHVNAEDPEAVVYVAELALEYRQRYKKDVVIDMWCYRRWGHNEGDDPSFTQPIMAALIKKKSSTLKTYAERLLAEGVLDEAQVREIRDELDAQLEKAQSAAKEKPEDPSIDPGSWRWQGLTHEFSHVEAETGAPRETLEEVARALSSIPAHFKPHKILAKLLKARTKAVLDDEPLDWGTAEMLAYGTLLLEGAPVRLSGQDARRGTFSHRHTVVVDTETAEEHYLLNHMRELGEPGVKGREPLETGDDGRPRQARFCVYDSPLAEYSVLGFEYGYSLAEPNMLVVWEAQFGDFSNGAQIMIDQFIASAEIKWQRWSGLTLLLPHGYEGQGPEHSSARLERFLQLCADGNMQVIHPTTPAQNFHALRRQVRRDFRKPLIVMSPKSLLRFPEARSAVAELIDGRFQEVIDDPAFDDTGADRAAVERIAFCSGKVYYDLAKRREETQRSDVAIVRVEQLYPLQSQTIEQIVARYPKGAERVWVQEEPKNMGAYTHVDLALRESLGWSPVRYIGREASATPAVGSKKMHAKQLDDLLSEAIGAAQREPVSA